MRVELLSNATVGGASVEVLQIPGLLVSDVVAGSFVHPAGAVGLESVYTHGFDVSIPEDSLRCHFAGSDGKPADPGAGVVVKVLVDR